MADHSNARSWVIYGRSGTGKTTLAGTFPKPLVYLDVKDHGTDSISDVDGIKLLKIDTFEEAENMYWWLRKNKKKFKTVVIDTASQLQLILTRETALAKGKDVANATKWGTLTRQEWGEIAATMKELLTNYRDLTDYGMEVVFIAQDRVFNVYEEDEDDEAQSVDPEVGPALSPSVARALNADVSVIGNTFIRERKVTKNVKGKKRSVIVPQYCLGLGPSSLYTRKVRKPKRVVLPNELVDPHYEDLVDIIEGET